MNNKEREEWVKNDEVLYRWWKSERRSLKTFVQEYHKAIDPYIEHMNHRYDGNGGSNCFIGCPYRR